MVAGTQSSLLIAVAMQNFANSGLTVTAPLTEIQASQFSIVPLSCMNLIQAMEMKTRTELLFLTPQTRAWAVVVSAPTLATDFLYNLMQLFLLPYISLSSAIKAIPIPVACQNNLVISKAAEGFQVMRGRHPTISNAFNRNISCK